MQRKLVLGALLAAVLAGAPLLAVDVWDQASENDNTVGTDNGLTHGSEQLHDLGANAGLADQDWYVLSNVSRSSYEVLIDGTTGDMNLRGEDVVRMSTGGNVVAQTAVPLAGYSAALRWQNNNATTETNWIRITGADCTSACSANDQYRIRMYETTYSLPRFNNSASQVTVLSVASMASFACSASFHFYANNGTYLGTQINAYTARELYVLNTASLGYTQGTSGSIIISHTCGYGGLAGKAVALEPATGFTFDTQLVPRIK